MFQDITTALMGGSSSNSKNTQLKNQLHLVVGHLENLRDIMKKDNITTNVNFITNMINYDLKNTQDDGLLNSARITTITVTSSLIKKIIESNIGPSDVSETRNQIKKLLSLTTLLLEIKPLPEDITTELRQHGTMILMVLQSLEPQAVSKPDEPAVHPIDLDKQKMQGEEVQTEQVAALHEIKEILETKTDANPTPTVNVEYLYEECDIDKIFACRFEEECAKPNSYLARIRASMHLINATGNALLEGQPEWCVVVKAKLQEDVCKQKNGTLLIPYNQGKTHWIGLVLDFNVHGKITTIQYINSMTITVEMDKIQEHLNDSKLLAETFTKENCVSLPLLKQSGGDRSTCGAYVIENLLLAAQNLENPKPISNVEIRTLHLECLKQGNPTFYYNSPKPTGGEVLGFCERQSRNIPSMSNVTVVHFSRPKVSEEESINEIVKIIKDIPKDCTKELKELSDAFVRGKDQPTDAYHTQLKKVLESLSQKPIIAYEMMLLKTQLFNDDDDSLNVENTVLEKIGADWESLGLPVTPKPKPTGSAWSIL